MTNERYRLLSLRDFKCDILIGIFLLAVYVLMGIRYNTLMFSIASMAVLVVWLDDLYNLNENRKIAYLREIGAISLAEKYIMFTLVLAIVSVFVSEVFVFMLGFFCRCWWIKARIKRMSMEA